MLALVVGGAAAVEPVALALQLPGIEPRLPARVLAADHVAVAVGKNRDERRVFDALGDQERAVLGRRVVEDPAAEAQALEAGLHLAGEIAREVGGALRILALGGNRHAAREVGEEAALVEVPLCVGDRPVPAHRRGDYLR